MQNLLLGVAMVLRDTKLIMEHQLDDPLFNDCPELAFVQGFEHPHYIALLATVCGMSVGSGELRFAIIYF